MHVQKTSWPIRISVVLALAAAVFVMPGCGLEHLVVEGRGALTRISVSNDGETSVTVKRPGYALHMESEGRATFTNDESDIATLEPDGEFELAEKLDGVEHEYKVEADRAGTLTRAYSRDGKNMPLDAAAKQWLAEALPRMFRESGLDADARVERLLAKGGPSLVLAEVDLAGSAYAKASYLGKLLATTRLDAKELERALASAAKIGSSYELRRALTQALQTQSLDGARLTALLETARKIDSDYELAELLIEAARHMPDDESAGVAWRAAMAQIGSDYELRRTIEAGLDRGDGDARFVATLLAIAAEHIDSDHELRTLLEKVARNATDTVVASAYLAAVRKLDSDFERRSALVALLENAKLDAANLVSALDATAELGSDFEKRTVLQALAASVAADPALNRRYREAARDMSDFERGEALRALDDATRP